MSNIFDHKNNLDFITDGRQARARVRFFHEKNMCNHYHFDMEIV